MPTASVITSPTQTVQAITLANGATAFIQHPSKASNYPFIIYLFSIH